MLETDLPLDIHVDSVGGGITGKGGVEWSREERSLRIWGEVVS
jgi:hypothetical protein